MTISIDKTRDHGPFDIIGDIHGCFDELTALFTKLGYDFGSENHGFAPTPPHGRKVIFLGDLVDRGPKVVPVLKLTMAMAKAGTALCLPGNHDNKLLRKLLGRNVQIKHGLAETMEQLDEETKEFRGEVMAFLEGLPSHFILDDGKLIVAHAGLKEILHGIESKETMDFALFGEPTGEIDGYGLPIRYNWAGDYRGRTVIVYGHTPVAEALWQNNTVDIDTGCVFGGKLTALRYPELELVEVRAERKYCEPSKPFLPEKV